MKPLILVITLACLLPIKADDAATSNHRTTQFERFQNQTQAVVITGSSDIGTFTGKIPGNTIDIKAFQSTANGLQSYAIQVSSSAGNSGGFSVFIDWDEVAPFLAALDSILKIDKTSTKLDSFSAHYATRGGLQISSGDHYPNIDKAINIGTDFNNCWVSFDPEDAAQVKALIQKAQTTLQDLQK